MSRGKLTPTPEAGDASGITGNAPAAPGTPPGMASQAVSPLLLLATLHLPATYGALANPQTVSLPLLLTFATRLL